MKQLTFIRRGKLEWQDAPDPRIESDQDVIVRTLVAGRCDLDFFIMLGMTPLEGPFPIGHEMAGEIVEVGAGVKNFPGGITIGLYAAAIAKALGSPRVDYVDTNPVNLELARKAGVNAIEADLENPLPDRYPITVDAAAQVAGLTLALKSLEPGGVCTSTSIHFNNETPIPFQDMYETDATLKVGRAHARTVMEKALALMVSGKFQPEMFITHRIPWEDAAKGYRQRATKLVVTRNA